MPVVALELRLVSELVRDRADRYEPLIGHLARHGCDVDLVRRSMADREVAPGAQAMVLDRLA